MIATMLALFVGVWITAFPSTAREFALEPLRQESVV